MRASGVAIRPSARALTGRGPLYRLFSIQGLFTLTFSGYTTILALWYVDRLGVSQANVGLLMLAVGVFLIFNEMVTLRFFEKRLGDVGTMLAGLLILPVALFLVRLPTSVAIFLPLSFLVNVGLALVMPTLQSVVTQAADEREEGQVQGINTSVAAVASTIAPLVAGASFAIFGGGVTILMAAATAALTAAVAVSSAGLLSGVTGAQLPTLARGRGTQHEHRQHGPVCSLANRVGSGQRSFALNIHGSKREHHGLTRCAADANARQID